MGKHAKVALESINRELSTINSKLVLEVDNSEDTEVTEDSFVIITSLHDYLEEIIASLNAELDESQVYFILLIAFTKGNCLSEIFHAHLCLTSF